ncbi:MAG: SGNH/GDSL hydrolase family protein [Acidobacteriota bacterium]
MQNATASRDSIAPARKMMLGSDTQIWTTLCQRTNAPDNRLSNALSNALITLVTMSLLFATTLGSPAAAANGNGNYEWVATWSTSLHEPDLGVPGLANTGFSNQTLRQIVHTSIGGRQVRVRLSTFKAKGLVIGSAHIALRSAGAAIVPGSDRTLTFGGKPSIILPTGASVVSDGVDLEVPALGDLAISIFVPENTGPATWHFEARQSLYISSAGDFTASPILPIAATVAAWFWLSGVDVTVPERTGSIAAFGESVTDGSQSTMDANHRWTDQLAQRLIAQHGNHARGVLNEGLAGGRLLHDSLGPNGLARFGRDVLSQTGLTHVMVHMGGNDLFSLNPAEEVTADQIIQGHKQLIVRAHAKGLRIYGCTLTPVEGFLVPGTPFPVFSPSSEAKRQAVNAWIRTSSEYDAMIDFDAIIRDPNSPTRILAVYDSGDHGHPNDAGYKALADTIDLKLFKNGRKQ